MRKVLHWRKPRPVKAATKCWFASDQLLDQGSIPVGCREIKIEDDKHKETGAWAIVHADARLAALLGAPGVAFQAPDGRLWRTYTQ